MSDFVDTHLRLFKVEESRCHPFLKELVAITLIASEKTFRETEAIRYPRKHVKWKERKKKSRTAQNGTEIRYWRIRYWICTGLQQQAERFTFVRFERTKMLRVQSATEGPMSSHHMWSSLLPELHRSTDKWRVRLWGLDILVGQLHHIITLQLTSH